MKRILLMLLICPGLHAQQLAPLTVEKIMRDAKWMGVSPSNPYWSSDSKMLYFNWNPDGNPGDSLYSVTLADKMPKKVDPQIRRELPSPYGTFNRARNKKLFEKNGDVFLLDLTSGRLIQITNTVEREYNASFSSDEKKIFFTAAMNLYSWDGYSGTITQLTDFKKGTRKADAKMSDQEKWLKADQLAYFDVLKKRNANKKLSDKIQKADRPRRPKEIYLDEKNADNIQMSPDRNFITYRLVKSATSKNAIVPSYVTESGFTEDISSRTKVGAPQNTSEFFVYDLTRDTVLQVKTDNISGIEDTPEFKKDYPVKTEKENKKDKKTEQRPVTIYGPIWSEDGKNNIVLVRSLDNKDRWIMTLDPGTQKLKLLDRQHDEAWLGNPGTGFFFGNLNVGWLGDNKTIWFQSEESGYAHVYLLDVTTGKKMALTSGKYEVQSVMLSNDKKAFYIVTNEVHPGEKQFYKLPVTGGKAEKITSMTGANDIALSPDEKWIAIRYSYSNKPWELYVQENKPGAKAQQITNSLSEEFKSYPWRDPEVLTFKARDGADVYTRLYRPAKPTGAAVIFVHG